MSSGYLYFSDDDRHRYLLEEFGEFTDTRRTVPKLAERQVALVSFERNAINAAAVMSRGAKVASYKWRVKLHDFLEFDQPLPLDDLAQRLEPRVARRFDVAHRALGAQFEAGTWEAVRLAVAAVRPELAAGLEQLELKASARRPRLYRGDTEPIVAYEHDAVGLALELAGMDRRPFLNAWVGTETTPFLAGLEQFRVPEDRMIEHDARVFGGWQLLRQGPVGMAEFRQGPRRLTVINVNRAGVEHALGVDLVYYNHDFDAYVLVQYKRMLPRSGGGGYEFRPDDQTRRELDRLRQIVPSSEAISSIQQFRLDPQSAYLKLCPSTTREAFSDQLIKGMYLPLGYWDVLVDSPNVLGPRGGIVVTYENVGRYMNNTTFIELVGASWIGSRGASTEQITAVIRESLASHSLILAEARGEVRPRR
jgi:hypothetical protein